MDRAAVVFHGDCDGVIAAGLYIRHFLMDLYPDRVSLKFTQPWRAYSDVRSAAEPNASQVVILDVAMDPQLFEEVKRLVWRGARVVFIDHHASSRRFLKELEATGAKVLWDLAQSTPQVLLKALSRVNSYEEFLIKVANVCEGADPLREAGDRARAEEIALGADRVKLSLALDPLDVDFVKRLVDAVVRGEEVWRLQEVVERHRRAKWLLGVMLRAIERRMESVGSWVLASFTSAESVLYAGLFGIAASELSKRLRRSIVIVRDEGRKVVITVRSSEKKALDVCKALADAMGSNSFGGHREAASITVVGRSLNEVVEKVREVLSAIGDG